MIDPLAGASLKADSSLPIGAAGEKKRKSVDESRLSDTKELFAKAGLTISERNELIIKIEEITDHSSSVHDFDNAVSSLHKIIRFYPNYGKAYYLLSCCECEKFRYGLNIGKENIKTLYTAITAIDTSIALGYKAPNSYSLYIIYLCELAHFCKTKNYTNKEDVIEFYEKFTKLGHENITEDYRTLLGFMCSIYLKKGDYHKGLSIYDKLIALYPSEVSNYKGAINTCYLMNDFKRAGWYCQQAFKNGLKPEQYMPDKEDMEEIKRLRNRTESTGK